MKKFIWLSLYFLVLVFNIIILDYEVGYLKTNKDLIAMMNQLKSDVAGANQFIRNAAIITNLEQRELELEKRFITRKSASDIYTKLESYKLRKVDREVVNLLLKERLEYRDAQNKVVSNIRSGKNKEIVESFVPYEQLQIRYNERINMLITSFSNQYDKSYKFISRIVIFTVILVNGVFFYFYIWNKERKCS